MAVGGVVTRREQLLMFMLLACAFYVCVSILFACNGARESITELYFMPVHPFLVNFSRFRIFYLIHHYFGFLVASAYFAQLLKKGQIFEYLIVVVGEAPILAAFDDGLRIHCLEEHAPSYRGLSLLTLRCSHYSRWTHAHAHTGGEERRRRVLPLYTFQQLSIYNGGDKSRWIRVYYCLGVNWIILH